VRSVPEIVNIHNYCSENLKFYKPMIFPFDFCEKQHTYHLVFLSSVSRLLVTGSVVPSSPILVTLKKKEISFSKTSVLTTATRRNIPEDAIFYSHRRENLKSYITYCSFLIFSLFLSLLLPFRSYIMPSSCGLIMGEYVPRPLYVAIYSMRTVERRKLMACFMFGPKETFDIWAFCATNFLVA
jgi:hypothetical protein